MISRSIGLGRSSTVELRSTHIQLFFKKPVQGRGEREGKHNFFNKNKIKSTENLSFQCFLLVEISGIEPLTS